MTNPSADSENAELLRQLDRLNQNIERDIISRQSWKLALRNGFIAAVGGAIGTTIVLTIVVRVLQPYLHLETLHTGIERPAENQSK
jgi:hypothetical protein